MRTELRLMVIIAICWSSSSYADFEREGEGSRRSASVIAVTNDAMLINILKPQFGELSVGTLRANNKLDTVAVTPKSLSLSIEKQLSAVALDGGYVRNLSVRKMQMPELVLKETRIGNDADLHSVNVSKLDIVSSVVGNRMSLRGNVTRIMLRHVELKELVVGEGESTIIELSKLTARRSIMFHKRTVDRLTITDGTDVADTILFVDCVIGKLTISNAVIGHVHFTNTTIDSISTIEEGSLKSPVSLNDTKISRKLLFVLDTTSLTDRLPLDNYGYIKRGEVGFVDNEDLTIQENKHRLRSIFHGLAALVSIKSDPKEGEEILRDYQEQVASRFGDAWDGAIGWLFNYGRVPFNFISILLTTYLFFTLVYLGYGVHSIPLGVEVPIPDSALHRWTTAFWFSGSVLVSIRFKQHWTLVQQRGLLVSIILEWMIGVILLLAFATFATDSIQGLEFLRRWFGSY